MGALGAFDRHIAERQPAHREAAVEVAAVVRGHGHVVMARVGDGGGQAVDGGGLVL